MEKLSQGVMCTSCQNEMPYLYCFFKPETIDPEKFLCESCRTIQEPDRDGSLVITEEVFDKLIPV